MTSGVSVARKQSKIVGREEVHESWKELSYKIQEDVLDEGGWAKEDGEKTYLGLGDQLKWKEEAMTAKTTTTKDTGICRRAHAPSQRIQAFAEERTLPVNLTQMIAAHLLIAARSQRALAWNDTELSALCR